MKPGLHRRDFLKLAGACSLLAHGGLALAAGEREPHSARIAAAVTAPDLVTYANAAFD